MEVKVEVRGHTLQVRLTASRLDLGVDDYLLRIILTAFKVCEASVRQHDLMHSGWGERGVRRLCPEASLPTFLILIPDLINYPVDFVHVVAHAID